MLSILRLAPLYLVLFGSLLLNACGLGTQSQVVNKSLINTPTLIPTATVNPTSPPVVQSPTPDVPTPVLAASSVPTPETIELATPAGPPTPVVDFGDLSPFRKAMRAEFTQDIDTVAAAGSTRYYIELAFKPGSYDPANGVSFTGVERVRYTNTEEVPLNEIYFRLYPNLSGYGGEMQVDRVILDDQLMTPSLEAEGSALKIELPSALAPGDSLDMTLFFSARLPVRSELGYNIFSFTDSTAALANFYPAVATYDDAWDTVVPPPYGDATYLDTSLYEVTVTVPEEMVVAGSGSTLEQITNEDGTKTFRLVSGPMRDFYLVMNPTYQVLTDQVDGITVNSYFPPELNEGGQRALEYTVDALRIFNRQFGPYPYAEFDIVATPTTAGGVEYPGVVVIAERIMNQEGGFFQHAVAHEVAHQWWYGMVGNNQVLEPWLDEAITNYSAAIYWEEAEGPDAAGYIIDNLFSASYERAKSQELNRAVIGPVESFSPGEYAAFVYGKGPLFFHALRQTYGDELYFRIMQTYLDRYRYEQATAGDLFSVIEETTGQSVEPLVETWLQAP